MFLDKSLSIAFLISAFFHTLIFLQAPHFKGSSITKKAATLKINYLSPEKVSFKEARVRKKPRALAVQQAKRKNVAAKPKAVKKVVNVPKPGSQQMKIEIPPDLPKEKEALYLDYYQSIREKIKRFVLNNYPRYIAYGDVCLYFVLSSNGELKQISIVQERSIQNRLLKEIAKKSVLEATPFLPFPEGLNQGRLSFNVIISFELEN